MPKKSKEKPVFLFLSDSGKPYIIDCNVCSGGRKYLKKYSQFHADRTGERVTAYQCKRIGSPLTPAFYIPEGSTASEKRRLKRISVLKAELTTAKAIFLALPKKGSFSGIHYADKIDSLQKELDALGDKSERMYPEVTIEVG